MNKLKSDGFAVLGIILIIVIVAIVGFTGYKVYQANQDASVETQDTTQNVVDESKATDVTTAPAVKTSSDLDEALQAIDATDPGGSNVTDANAIDSAVVEF